MELPTGDKKNLLFTEFIDNPIRLQVWVSGDTTNFQRIGNKLRDMSNTMSLVSAVAKR